ncbi:hypothetical protein IVA95_10120 [Bradyrhizobium sp. 157]|uniref:hypothetical protein n=1 Tax=Bradyrhizobium sp. 157 TaxID=2782631 RepID=UPI001FF84D9C|nr:hypothetical protein [Bradyrhizobium sp. 157]MCK1637946.1 hypothetical protein [Bradyrhizobium sp. 157]
MTKFQIQIHPHRSPGLDTVLLLSQFEALSNERDWIQKPFVKHGFDEHAFINVMFETDYPKLFWKLLREKLDQADDFGLSMRATSIIICEGKSGWDDYLMLHHYDPGISREHLPE